MEAPWRHHGAPWISMELQGDPRSSTEPPWRLQGAPRSSMELQGDPRSSTELQGAPRSSTELHGTPWSSTELPEAPWLNAKGGGRDALGRREGRGGRPRPPAPQGGACLGMPPRRRQSSEPILPPTCRIYFAHFPCLPRSTDHRPSTFKTCCGYWHDQGCEQVYPLPKFRTHFAHSHCLLRSIDHRPQPSRHVAVIGTTSGVNNFVFGISRPAGSL